MATEVDIYNQFDKWYRLQFMPWALEETKTELIRHSPTVEEEEDMLVRGRVTADLSSAVTKHLMTTNSKTVGTREGGRFTRTGPTIKGLIWSMRLGAGGRVTHLPTRDVGKFSWKRRDGTIHETRPFNERFLYAVEGKDKKPWRVRSRKKGGVLEPEANIFCLEMMKTAQKFSMFEKAAKAVWPRINAKAWEAWAMVEVAVLQLRGTT